MFELLFDLTLSFGGLIGVVYIVKSLLDYEGDFLFFIRPLQARKKMNQNDYNSMEELIDLLFKTSKMEWEIDTDFSNNCIIYYPFKNEKDIYFRFNCGKITLYRKKRCLLYLGENYHYNDIDDSIDERKDKLKIKSLIEHLEEISSHHINNEREKEKIKTEKREKENQRQLEELERNLIDALNDNFWLKKRFGKFQLRDKKTENYYQATLYYKEDVCINLFLQNDNLSYEIENEETQLGEIVERNKGKIISFIRDKVILEKKEVGLEFEGHYKKIQRLLEDLKNETLTTDEESHRVNHTYPSDIKKLIKLYHDLKNPKEMENYVEEILEKTYEKLIVLEQTIEKRKQQQIIKQGEILKVRD